MTSAHTLIRRMFYGGRKGRAAKRRLEDMARTEFAYVAHWVLPAAEPMPLLMTYRLGQALKYPDNPTAWPW